jgi:hypothetical protein
VHICFNVQSVPKYVTILNHWRTKSVGDMQTRVLFKKIDIWEISLRNDSDVLPIIVRITNFVICQFVRIASLRQTIEHYENGARNGGRYVTPRKQWCPEWRAVCHPERAMLPEAPAILAIVRQCLHAIQRGPEVTSLVARQVRAKVARTCRVRSAQQGMLLLDPLYLYQ